MLQRVEVDALVIQFSYMYRCTEPWFDYVHGRLARS
jgi:hypothetical protein